MREYEYQFLLYNFEFNATLKAAMEAKQNDTTKHVIGNSIFRLAWSSSRDISCISAIQNCIPNFCESGHGDGTSHGLVPIMENT